jgi:hypothetical protein
VYGALEGRPCGRFDICPAARAAAVLDREHEVAVWCPADTPWPAVTVAIEPSAFARKNLLVGRDEGGAAGRLVTVDPRTGVAVSESPALIGGIVRDSVHYVDLGAGTTRMSVGTDAGMYLTR